MLHTENLVECVVVEEKGVILGIVIVSRTCEEFLDIDSFGSNVGNQIETYLLTGQSSECFSTSASVL